ISYLSCIPGYNVTNFKNYSICNLVDIQILDLSYNKFNGEVPHCLGNNSTQLVVLNLQSNNFKGIIPSAFSTCDLLEYVDFTDNQLEGSIPRSLSKCQNLKVLNLRNNKFKDVFPYWLGSLPSLEVLSLPFNKFHGDISNNLSKIATSPFSNLQILDLSNNNFCGKLPFMYIKQFRSMMDMSTTIGSPRYLEDEFGNYNIYMYSIKMIIKGKQLEYKKIITSMSTFDMSNNHFEGEIPHSIGMLRALRNLNLSHNLLTGNIPPSIGNLSLLDGLDLSPNRLIGEIPQELVSLTFLEVFNVSYNQLEGPIPHGNNFDTFLSDSYQGNLELCGAPLLECRNNNVVQSLNNDNVEEKTKLSMWEVVVIGFIFFTPGSGSVNFIWIRCRPESAGSKKLGSRSVKTDPDPGSIVISTLTHFMLHISFLKSSSLSYFISSLSLDLTVVKILLVRSFFVCLIRLDEASLRSYELLENETDGLPLLLIVEELLERGYSCMNQNMNAGFDAYGFDAGNMNQKH
ncbi:receptor-like protein Cf-9 homolog, partial [Amaranthus tricolor]|uniref:receptor-like protein Cf-9 homolog n=1 Tax=Amaranthus tricolor TaxID=29722 RepID=UPI00258515B0